MNPKIYKEYMVVPEEVLYVLNILKQYGYEAYIVGGACRDHFLNKTPKDFDICTNAIPNQMLEIGKKENLELIETGLQHGTITFHIEKENIEVTTYRTDGEYVDHRRPTKVEFVQAVIQDLKRRDFTFNAILYDPQIGFIDYFKGVEDLKNKVVRCIGNPEDRFEEDALRILRAIRFASKLDFIIEEKTHKAILNKQILLEHISKERIQMELTSILSCGYKGVAYIMDYYNLFVNYVFGVSLFNCWFILKTSLPSLDDVSVILALLLNYLEKYDIIWILKENLKYDKKTIKEVIGIHKAYKDYIEKYSVWNNEDDYLKVVRFLIQDYGSLIVEKLFGFIEVLVGLPSYYRNSLQTIEEQGLCCSFKELKINGNDLLSLGFEGEEIKKILKLLLDLVILETIENDKESLLNYAKGYATLINNWFKKGKKR